MTADRSRSTPSRYTYSVNFPPVLIISTIILTKSHIVPSSTSISSPTLSEKLLKATAFTLKPRNNNSSASDRHPRSSLHHVYHFVGVHLVLALAYGTQAAALLRDTNIVTAISSTTVKNMAYIEQFAAAAYCGENNGRNTHSTNKVVVCDASCGPCPDMS